MNRIKETFNKGKVFAAYLTAGDGDLNTQLSMIQALLDGGVNLLEIGVPFSDPIADGVVIQRAMHRALTSGTTLHDVILLIQAVRNITDVPIILFTYYNPILKWQQQNILKQIKEAGADGVLVVDLPFFEAEDHLKNCAQLQLAPIAVLSPTTSPERLQDLVKQCDGFLYYACQKGTTGVRKDLPSDVSANLKQIKKISNLPVIIGFGIADRNASQTAIEIADGFVVGSYFIEAIESGMNAHELTACARAINPLLKDSFSC
jgi:tryptophan synthase alpha chain